jgi:hypothetical protein
MIYENSERLARAMMGKKKKGGKKRGLWRLNGDLSL